MKDSGAADVHVEEFRETLAVAIVSVRWTSSAVDVVDALLEGLHREADAAPVIRRIGIAIAAVDVHKVAVPRARVHVVVDLAVHPDFAIVNTRLGS